MWYPGQLVVLPYARASEGQQVQINIIEAKAGNTIALRYPVEATASDVPVILGMQGIWGRFDDGPTAGDNDVFLRRATYEYGHIAPYGASFGVLFQNCNQMYLSGKIDGNSPDFNNFAAAGGIELDWGFFRQRGQLWVLGDDNLIDLTGTTLGMSLSRTFRGLSIGRRRQRASRA